MSLDKDIIAPLITPAHSDMGIMQQNSDEWKLFRKNALENMALETTSDLQCPTCKTNLPYNKITQVSPDKKEYWCPICREYFYKKE